jgi:phosphoenolpyruvate-protein phosphotransferase
MSSKSNPTRKHVRGLALTPGVACGKAFVMSRGISVKESGQNIKIDRTHEIKKFKEALLEIKKEILFLKERAASGVGAVGDSIFDVQALILEDSTLMTEIERNILKKNLSLQLAVEQTLRVYKKKFKTLKNRYLSDKFYDLEDVLIKIAEHRAQGDRSAAIPQGENRILVAEKILPSLVLSRNKSTMAGIVTVVGGLGSHATVLARAYGVPTIGVSLGFLKNIKDDDVVLLDGQNGDIFIHPSQELIGRLNDKKGRYLQYFEQERSVASGEAKTRDEISLRIEANCGSIEDVDVALSHGADGIGLFRTEYTFFQYTRFPSEEEQVAIYKRVLEKFTGKTVVIRTLDLGGDKSLPYFLIPKQLNPYLGWRSLKISFDHPVQFKIQLKALLRASAYGDLKILFPMVATYQDLVRCKEFLKESADELEKEGKEYKRMTKIGAMIEVPAAVVCLPHLLEEVDFISIGSNDLIQHTLAVDRNNPRVESFYVPHHPAVIRTIADILRCAREMGKPASLCGEMGRNPYYVMLFIGLGLRQLSMAPYFIPIIKSIVRSIHSEEAASFFLQILNLKSGSEIIAALRKKSEEVYPDIHLVT